MIDLRRIRLRTTTPIALALLGAVACDDGGGGGRDPIPFDGTLTLSGRATYDAVPVRTAGGISLDFDDASVRPIRGAEVTLIQDGERIATTTTNDDGRYEFELELESIDDLVVAVLARTTTPAIEVVDNTDDDALWALSAEIESDDPTIDLHATHGWNGSDYVANRRLAAPFALLDTILTASRAFLAVRTITFPPLTVNWSPDNVPESGNEAAGRIGTSHYSPEAGEIYVLGKSQVDTDEFDTHVVVHEWTHYVDARLSRSDSPGGSHGGGDVLDPRLAFGEGFANAVAGMALGDPLYVDTLWNSGSLTGFSVDSETPDVPSDDTSPGVFSELSVNRVVYDLFDSGAGEAHDTVGYGLGPIYDVLVGPQRTTPALTTLGSFIAGFKQQAGVNGAAVNTILAYYDIGAITDEWGAGDSDLAAMYTDVAALPYTTNVTLDSTVDSNKRGQNRYFVVEGTGGPIEVTASHASEDVGIWMYHSGELVGGSDEFLVGTETFTVTNTVDGDVYVVVLTGFAEDIGNYSAALAIETP